MDKTTVSKIVDMGSSPVTPAYGEMAEWLWHRIANAHSFTTAWVRIPLSPIISFW